MALVNADEIDIRILSSSDCSGLTHGKTNGDDHIVALVGEQGDIGSVVFGIFGLDVVNNGVKFRLSLLHAFPGRLVEGLVVHFTNICDQANAEDFVFTAVGFGGFTTTTGAQGQGGKNQKGDQEIQFFRHMGVPPTEL